LKVEVIRPGSQTPEVSRAYQRESRRRAFLALAALAAGVAPGIGKSESYRVVPNIAVTASYSDNVALAPSALAQPGWVTTLAPGVLAEVSGARVKGFLDARLFGTSYSSDSSLNSTQASLNAFAKVEAVENLLFVDARANSGQQNRSAFGAAATPDLPTPSTNAVQTNALQVSPFIRGQVSDVAKYQLRFTESWVRANDVRPPETRTSEWIGSIGSASPSAKLGWTVAASALSLRNDLVGTREDNRIRGSLIYALNPQLHVSLVEGYESTDFAGPPKQGSGTPGIGLAWTPSERTQLAAVYERRFFGDGYNVIFNHRTPLSAWSIVGTKDVEALPAQLLASNSLGSIQGLMSNLLTSTIPDPEARAEAVRRRLEETGISGSSALSSNVLTARPFILWNNFASAALLGATNTITLTLAYKEQRSLGTGVAAGGSVVNDFRQRGLNANWAHKLSPLTSLTLAATALLTDDLTIAARQSRQYSSSLFLSSQLGPKTSASLGLRHVDFNGTTAPETYRENAIFGTLSIRL